MANRFVRGIQNGTIASIEDLKSAYKTAAKQTHPDSAAAEASGSGDGRAAESGHEAFLRLRIEYEHALKELSRSAAARDAAPDDDEKPAYATAVGDPYAALALLLKRGFPKTPRHKKENERYRYVRLRARSALAKLDTALPILFDAMEKEMIAQGDSRKEADATALGLMMDFLKAKRTGSAALETAVRMECARTFPPVSLSPRAERADEDPAVEKARPGPAVEAFFIAFLRRTAHGSK